MPGRLIQRPTVVIPGDEIGQHMSYSPAEYSSNPNQPNPSIFAIARISRLFSKKNKSPKSADSKRSSTSWSASTCVDSEDGSPVSPKVQQRNPNLRSATDATLGALLMTLEVLGKSPFPGIEMVTNGLRESITRATKYADNKTALTQLTERLLHLQDVTANMHESLRQKPLFIKHAERVTRTLQDLKEQIDYQNSRGTASKFFSSVTDAEGFSGYLRTLDGLHHDLNSALGNDTNSAVKEILDNQKQQKQQQQQITRAQSYPRTGQIYEISNAVIDTDGDLFCGNTGNQYFSLNGAKINSRGHLGSGNNSNNDLPPSPPNGWYPHGQFYPGNPYHQPPTRYGSYPAPTQQGHVGYGPGSYAGHWPLVEEPQDGSPQLMLTGR